MSEQLYNVSYVVLVAGVGRKNHGYRPVSVRNRFEEPQDAKTRAKQLPPGTKWRVVREVVRHEICSEGVA